MKLILYFNTIKYLKLIQIFGRLIYLFKKIYYGYLNFPSGKIKENLVWDQLGLKNNVSFIYHDPWNNQKELANKTFTFLNDTVKFDKIDWDYSEKPLLWRFNINYFNYLHLVRNKDEICENWVRNNLDYKKIGWHPYPTSLRIVNFCKNNINSKLAQSSLYAQAKFLYNNLEFHLLGNHLLEDARALIFAGLYFKNENDVANWFEKGMRIYLNQIKRQVLPDGGHFERSPMYHAIILEGLLDIINIIKDDDNNDVLVDIAKKMLVFQVSLTHPDGNICLFNDAAQEIAPSTNDLVSYGTKLLGYIPKTNATFTNSGYYIYKDSNIYLAIDGGEIGPYYLPGHAHADIFSFELSIRGQQVIVDSGTYNYIEGDYREYLRGTSAHNTICIDDTNQVEIWKNFRVARRYSPNNILVSEDELSWIFEGTYEGYSKLLKGDIVHKRSIIIEKKNKRVVIEDFIEGSGLHKISSHLHFNNNIIVNNGIITLNKEKSLIFRSNESFKVITKNISPKFGVKLPTKCILIEKITELPYKINMVLNY